MNEPTYGPPATTPGRVVVGRVLTVIMSIVGPPAAAVAAFIGAIEWSGCFIECNQDNPDHVTGGLLWLLAAALLLAAPILAAALVRRGTWVAAAIAVPVLEVALVAALTN